MSAGGEMQAGTPGGVSVPPGDAAGTACALTDAWTLRNATAEAFLKAEDHVRLAIERASVAELIALIEAFSPARSPGPEWTRSFEPLVERLWAWCDAATMAALEAEFQARGMPWLAVANALAPEHGEELRGRLRQPAWARYPSFTIA